MQTILCCLQCLVLSIMVKEVLRVLKQETTVGDVLGNIRCTMWRIDSFYSDLLPECLFLVVYKSYNLDDSRPMGDIMPV